MSKPFSILSCLLVLGILLTASPGQAQQLNIAEQEAIQAAVDRVAASVVQIETVGGLIEGGGPIEGASRTTGTIVSPDGFILSSLYGFIQEPSGILVTMPGGKRVAGKIIAKDTQRNLILLKVETDAELAVPEAVARAELQPGQWAIALGKTFAKDLPSVSVGIVSATHRVWGKAVQTDAKISPNNYGGPLIDIQGRVIGILTPLSPQDPGATGGFEWYDSGIGFAVPLTDIQQRLDTLKEGEDLKPGLLGINLKGNDIVADPAEIAAVRYNSPAQVAGIQEKDVLIGANGRPIVRQAQLKHILGEAYAGDTLEFKVKRGEEELTFSITLADELIPYERPFLGILLDRNILDAAVVNHVFDDTAAKTSGVQAGDKIVKYDDTEVDSPQTLREAVATAEPDVPHKLVVLRGEDKTTLEVTPTSMPNEFLAAVAAPTAPEGVEAREGVVTGESDFQLAEEKNSAKLFVPEAAKKLPSLGLVVLLGDAEFKIEPQWDAWKKQAETFGYALLEIQPASESRWTRPEISVVRKMIDRVRDNYNIDVTRTVTVGGKSGGAMALLHGFENRDVQTGAVAIEAGIPRGTNIPDNEPLERLEIVFLIPKDSETTVTLKPQIETLEKMKFTVIRSEATGSKLSETDIEAVSNWLNTLDRI
ncbi:putative periplasmic serine endoprotease DegP-like precursor [Bremerella volcania]|uniref:Putative periplasmic serine endoprotease DegP-like n=1 Tax=Bremerella volcania TaxID=2527984 RepID=A0A518C7L0_9BACT|nr:PDZ domain-containing protein [Bremerella volcania]QDU75207.1 putative periplasmic serine endoprotease DegP-like precursor [Bremerella volcania]